MNQTTETQPSVFELLGGEQGIRQLVDRFYDVMDVDEDLTVLRQVHGASLDQARDKLFWYLCGYFGGPQHYIERFGHPRLRARHLPYSIGILERDQWLLCMGRAMKDLSYDDRLIERMLEIFFGVADWMRNRDG
ncbi:MAG: group II truncated hemoglobin [Burkholderiales bacterium]|nr:group II truncated hemoglobin [Burkholderiales bacterium]